MASLNEPANTLLGNAHQLLSTLRNIERSVENLSDTINGPLPEACGTQAPEPRAIREVLVEAQITADRLAKTVAQLGNSVGMPAQDSRPQTATDNGIGGLPYYGKGLR
jgi:hypothetical protein